MIAIRRDVRPAPLRLIRDLLHALTNPAGRSLFPARQALLSV